jgi:tetratricopeptide (TPR) repeat protein
MLNVEVHIERGLFAQAKELLNKSLEDYGQSPHYFYLLAVLAYREDDIAQAKAACLQALGIDPDNILVSSLLIRLNSRKAWLIAGIRRVLTVFGAGSR